MRRLLLAVLLAAVPAVPASAGVGACYTHRQTGVYACTGSCAPGDTITVTVLGAGGGAAHCGGATASCLAFRGACARTATAVTAGELTCEGGPNVVCSAGPLLVP